MIIFLTYNNNSNNNEKSNSIFSRIMVICKSNNKGRSSNYNNRSSNHYHHHNNNNRKIIFSAVCGFITNYRILVALVPYILHCASLFSNSYIEGEKMTHSFFSTTIIVFLIVISLIQDSEITTEGITVLDVCFVLLAIISNRIALITEGHGQDIATNFSFMSTIIPLCCFPFLYYLFRTSSTYMTAIKQKNNSYSTADAIFPTLLGSISYVLISAFWAAETYFSTKIYIYHIIFPRLVYIISVLRSFGYFVYYQKRLKCILHIQVVLGEIIFAILPTYIILCGPSSALTMLCYTCSAGSLIALLKKIFFTNCLNQKKDETAIPLISIVILVMFFGRSYYFFTGHHNEFNRLQVGAAFVGFDEFNYNIAGSLLFFNTFGTEIITLILLAVVLITISEALFLKKYSIVTKTEIDLNKIKTTNQPTQNERMLHTLKEGYLLLLILSTIRTLCTMVSVTILRRHLMVWAIFAPKFVFDCSLQVVQDIFIIALWIIIWEILPYSSILERKSVKRQSNH